MECVARQAEHQDRDLWVFELSRGTFDILGNRTPDGRRLVFSTERTGTSRLYSQEADGTGNAELLTSGGTFESTATVLPMADGSCVTA